MISGTLEIVRGSSTLDISDLTNYVVRSTDGFGMPPAHLISERGPLQHGESDRGYRLDPRLIQIVLDLRANDWAGHYARRSELLYYLSPTAAIVLRHTLPDGTVREIGGRCVEGPTYASNDRRLYRYQRAGIRIKCGDPAWYDPDRKSLRVVGGTGGAGFALPMPVPWLFGGVSVDTTVNLDYDGTWIEYPEIVITGPVGNAKIEHLETGDVLDFTGTTIAAGDHYTIDLRYGYKTVVDSSGANKVADLTPESDLATWHLQAGANTIRFTGASADTTTSILLRWYNRYLGV